MHSNPLICDILVYIDDNITNKITVDDLEKHFFYNRFYIMKLFKKEMKITLTNYINSLRIYKALLMIKETNYSLLNIAFKSGFYSIEYFSEMFKNIVGVNPQIAKNYLSGGKNINFNQISKVNNILSDLYSLKLFKDNYLLKRKPNKLPTRKLTIFK